MGETMIALTADEVSQIAPNGVIKVGIAVGPAASAVWAIRDAETGKPRGITVGIAAELSRLTGLAHELVEFSSSGDIVANAGSGKWDISFVPIDAERRKHVDVGPAYYAGVSTYLVREGAFRTVGDVDRSGVRVIGIEGTATFRSAERALHNTTIQPVRELDEAVALFTAGDADAVALGKESIKSLIKTLPGTVVAEGHFHEAATALVVPPGKAHALAAASRVIERLKADGAMRRIFDENGMAEADVAP